MFGVLGVYSELIWPGKIVPGIAGFGAAVAGGYFLWRLTPEPLGLSLLAIAVILFALDGALATFFMAGIAGTAALAYGFLVLFTAEQRISPVLVIPCCAALGTLTAALNGAARRARRNKRIIAAKP
jgi:membrane-bound serine protease (ClpP class)